MAVVDTGVERYEDDQLVVDTRDVGLVKQALNSADIRVYWQQGPSSDDLGLDLLYLPRLQADMRRFSQDGEVVKSATCVRRCQGAAEGTPTDLDLLLFVLRRHFGTSFHHWAPLIGKNRTLDGVNGWPYVKGGVGELMRLDSLDVPAGAARADLRVGILDTRIFPHVDLVGRYVGDSITDLADVVTDVGDSVPSVPSTAGHATFIAGLILQRAPDVGLVVRAALSDDAASAKSWDVATKLASFAHTDVAVVNMSLGCATEDGQPPLVLRRAVERLAPDVVLVAAAGNNGAVKESRKAGVARNTPMWPAAFDDVVAVGADTAEGGRAEFSPHVPWVNLTAPGVGVASTFLPGEVSIVHRDDDGHLVSEGTSDFGPKGYATWNGTSFATAIVTGEIAARALDRRIGVREALDQLLHPTVPVQGDIRPFEFRPERVSP